MYLNVKRVCAHLVVVYVNATNFLESIFFLLSFANVFTFCESSF